MIKGMFKDVNSIYVIDVAGHSSNVPALLYPTISIPNRLHTANRKVDSRMSCPFDVNHVLYNRLFTHRTDRPNQLWENSNCLLTYVLSKHYLKQFDNISIWHSSLFDDDLLFSVLSSA